MFHLTPGDPVGDGVRAVADAQLDLALTAIDGGDRHEAVHEARKSCKKVRALLRLVRDAVPDTYDRVNTHLRDTARLVSQQREAGAAVETHDALAAALGEEALAPYAVVREQLVAQRDGAADDVIRQRLPEVHERLVDLRVAIEDWDLPAGDAVDTLRAGYARTYGRARDRWRDATGADPSTHVWHEWRKRVKYHRYHVDLLTAAWPPVMTLRESLLHDLTDHLGDDHDLADLREAVAEQGVLDVGAAVATGYVGLLDARRTRLQHAALPLSARLFAAPTDEHCDLTFTWWRRAVTEATSTGPADPDLGRHTPVVPPGT